MLVLTRKFGEKIVIGEDIIITVVKLDGNKVRLGFEAPREVNIARSEIMEEHLELSGNIENSMTPNSTVSNLP